jgi:hypothetical protein
MDSNGNGTSMSWTEMVLFSAVSFTATAPSSGTDSLTDTVAEVEFDLLIAREQRARAAKERCACCQVRAASSRLRIVTTEPRAPPDRNRCSTSRDGLNIRREFRLKCDRTLSIKWRRRRTRLHAAEARNAPHVGVAPAGRAHTLCNRNLVEIVVYFTTGHLRLAPAATRTSPHAVCSKWEVSEQTCYR